MKFKRIAELCWEELFSTLEQGERGDLLSDWHQFHWELLVEGTLQAEHPGLVLELYGGGGETVSGRILEPEAVATHKIYCRPVSGDTLNELIGMTPVKFPRTGLPFEQLVSAETSEFFNYHKPPLNSVLLKFPEEGEEQDLEYPMCFRLDDVEFNLGEK